MSAPESASRCSKGCPWRNSPKCPTHAEYTPQPTRRVGYVRPAWLVEEDERGDK